MLLVCRIEGDDAPPITCADYTEEEDALQAASDWSIDYPGTVYVVYKATHTVVFKGVEIKEVET
jgi:hypothetical protein